MQDIVKIVTQAEWDALPVRFQQFTRIEIHSPEGTWITVRGIPENSHVEAWGSAHVVARESAHVVAWESAHVEAWGSAHVEAWGSAHVVAWESAHVVARESAHVVAWESAHVVARESAHVEAWGSAHVEAWGSAHVVARESAHVEAWESAHVVAWGSAHVEAWESAHVEAWGSVHVVAWGRAAVHQKSGSCPELYGQSVCFVYENYASPIRRSDDAVIIQVTSPQGNREWLEAEGIVESDGHVILYKRISSGFLTQESEPWQTSWEIGEVKTIDNWTPESSECGSGKFHACSRPYFCDEFRSAVGDRYIAINIDTADLHAWPSPEYPHKIAFRKGVVLYECDRYGTEIKSAIARAISGAREGAPA